MKNTTYKGERDKWQYGDIQHPIVYTRHHHHHSTRNPLTLGLQMTPTITTTIPSSISNHKSSHQAANSFPGSSNKSGPSRPARNSPLQGSAQPCQIWLHSKLTAKCCLAHLFLYLQQELTPRSEVARLCAQDGQWPPPPRRIASRVERRVQKCRLQEHQRRKCCLLWFSMAHNGPG